MVVRINLGDCYTFDVTHQGFPTPVTYQYTPVRHIIFNFLAMNTWLAIPGVRWEAITMAAYALGIEDIIPDTIPREFIFASNTSAGLIRNYRQSHMVAIRAFLAKILLNIQGNRDYVERNGASPWICHTFAPAFFKEIAREILTEANLTASFINGVLVSSFNVDQVNWAVGFNQTGVDGDFIKVCVVLAP